MLLRPRWPHLWCRTSWAPATPATGHSHSPSPWRVPIKGWTQEPWLHVEMGKFRQQTGKRNTKYKNINIGYSVHPSTSIKINKAQLPWWGSLRLAFVACFASDGMARRPMTLCSQLLEVSYPLVLVSAQHVPICSARPPRWFSHW